MHVLLFGNHSSKNNCYTLVLFITRLKYLKAEIHVYVDDVPVLLVPLCSAMFGSHVALGGHPLPLFLPPRQLFSFPVASGVASKGPVFHPTNTRFIPVKLPPYAAPVNFYTKEPE